MSEHAATRITREIEQILLAQEDAALCVADEDDYAIAYWENVIERRTDNYRRLMRHPRSHTSEE